MRCQPLCAAEAFSLRCDGAGTRFGQRDNERTSDGWLIAATAQMGSTVRSRAAQVEHYSVDWLARQAIVQFALPSNLTSVAIHVTDQRT